MRLRHRNDDDLDRTDRPDDDRVLAQDPDRDSDLDRERRLDREEAVDTRTGRWDLGSVLAAAAGVALIVIGTLALARTGIDRSWYQPVDQVLGMDHTALLGAVEVGVGVVLVLAGLAGARMFAALVALAVGATATVVAIEPDVVDRELAVEQEWATVLAIAGFALAAVLIVSRERRHERRIERRSVRTA
jgi:hypothetical protein